MRDIIIIPTYNERKNIKNLLRAIYSIYPKIHIVVVDDNSPDHTAEEVRNMQTEFPNLELLSRPHKEGLGKAYIEALRRVLSLEDVRSVCTMDADFSHSAKYLQQMFSCIEGSDAVIGSRYVKGGGVHGYPISRRLVSFFASYYCRLLFNLPIHDYTSGFMCIRASMLKKVNFEKMNSSGFAFLVELKYLVWKMGGRFVEFPIILENRKEGKSKIGNTVILEGALLPWKLKFRDYILIFKKVLLIGQDALSKRGILFLMRHAPKVVYYSYIKKDSGFFVFQNKKYKYFNHLYNATCLNERSVEVPIAWDLVDRYQGGKILEVGNVLGHYFHREYDVLDKYEQAEGVINEDVIDFRPKDKYDLIVSVSTLEHVGFDEEEKDPKKILLALDNLKNMLAPGGRMLITLGLGYNNEMDKLLLEGNIKFDGLFFLKRDSCKNIWREVELEEVKGISYNYSLWTARGIAVGVTNN